ncbi:hypothetical protein BA190_09990 [Labrys sp. WJW]|uniref:DUF4326 domain-containing protein n=1 Tax=Labrys sp. WJW TaxID=1737983 RepID=UPI000832875A|nr:DUF4326 domain-containing protein [Labrys sp. WJW]OCC05224.1 hypothetical protein BA190_09990 [Labrys sp. WJW]
MAERPIRVQLSRAKGWRMPDGTVKVDRSGPFGNPFTIAECREGGFKGNDFEIAARCVEAFRVWIDTPYWQNNWAGEESERQRTAMLKSIPALRGQNLACWCKPGWPCHADVLLEIANRPLCEEASNG